MARLRVPYAGPGFVRSPLAAFGDSLIHGLGNTPLQVSPAVAIATLGSALYITDYSNVAVDGYSLADMVALAPSVVDPLFRASTAASPVRLMVGGKGNLLISDGGANDAFFGADVATIEGRLSTYMAARKAVGWVNIWTGITLNNNPARAGSFDTVVPQVNADVRANPAAFHIDGFADFPSVPQAQLLADPTWYYQAPNWGHWTPALNAVFGTGVLATCITTTILAP